MFRFLTEVAGWIIGLGSLTSLTLRWWSGDHFLIARLGSYFLPWLLVLLVPGCLLAILLQRRWLAVSLLLPVLIIIYLYAPLFSPDRREKNASAGALKVMSYNVWSENASIGKMARVIRQVRPDILLLQEIRPANFRALYSALAGLYPETSLQAEYEPPLMQAVISRYPLKPLQALRKMGQAQQVAVCTPQGTITVFNVHPLRRGGWQRRYRQIISLLDEEVAKVPGAVILAGDFNITEGTQLYREVTGRLTDAHEQAGFGFGFTYPSAAARPFGHFRLPPLVRIDHIFYNQHLAAVSAATLEDPGGSDHYPVRADLSFQKVEP